MEVAVLGPEQRLLDLVVILTGKLCVDRQPQGEFFSLGEGGVDLILRAAGKTGLSEIRAHHQGIENLHPVHGWVGPTPFAFLDIGFKIDVSNNQ